MQAEEILQEISDYCRRAGLAESTFGRRAVNDGKLVTRLRDGGRITTVTLDRIRSFMHESVPATRGAVIERPVPPRPISSMPPAPPSGDEGDDPQRNFRFFDNRQKYLLFVNTCGEKSVIANRVGMELGNIHPRPPALRVFDAGVGDATVLSRVMRAMHERFSTLPFYIVGKEISLEDVRLALDKMADRFFEHPSTVLVLTNMYYSEAPWLTTHSREAASSMVWHELALTGNSAFSFESQISALQPFLADNWKARVSPKSGNPVYERPVVLVIYRQDHKFLLDNIIPKRGATDANYDLVMASQPYRLRSSVEFKAKKVIAPLARALGPGGRMIGIHSRGGDPGQEIIQKVWPGDNPYTHNRSIFKYDMHTLPTEISAETGSSIGTSTLFAAWNAAIYVAQVEDDRLSKVVMDDRYLTATREVLQKHGGLWFNDESYVISRKRD
jgi:hypothetical protein